MGARRRGSLLIEKENGCEYASHLPARVRLMTTFVRCSAVSSPSRRILLSSVAMRCNLRVSSIAKMRRTWVSLERRSQCSTRRDSLAGWFHAVGSAILRLAACIRAHRVATSQRSGCMLSGLVGIRNAGIVQCVGARVRGWNAPPVVATRTHCMNSGILSIRSLPAERLSYMNVPRGRGAL